MERQLYIFGSENPRTNGKLHLCDEDAKPLCGSNIPWGEATAVVTDIVDNIIYTKGLLKRENNISRCYLWESHKCLKCNKKLRSELTEQSEVNNT